MKNKGFHNLKMFQVFSVGLIGIGLMVFFSACSGSYTGPGIGSSSGTPQISSNTITGAISSISGNSVTLNVQGKSVTIHGLTPAQIAAIQNQIGKTYTFHVNQNTDQSYNVTSDPNAVEPGDGTPEVQNSPEAQAAGSGSISFIGPVQSINTNNVVVKLPDGQTLSMALNTQTDMSDFNGARPTSGQTIKVKAVPAVNGGFVATKLGIADSGDLQKVSQVTYDGTTTSAVGPDKTIHLKIGGESNYSFTIPASAEVKDFANAQSIGANQLVEVQVQYQGTNPTVLEVKAGS